MNDTRTRIIASLAPFAIAALWLIAQFDISLNSDHAWLMETAKRLLDGQAMSEGYYDPNPPLSILLYVPSVWINRYLFIPEIYSHYVFTALAVCGFAFAMDRILRAFTQLGKDARIMAVFCFVCANTFLTLAGNFYFGERDQFIFMGLITFIIVQISITRGIKTAPVLTNCMLIISAIFILLKPHYLIIPALFIFHRMISQRRLIGIINDIDVKILALCVIGYGGVIGLFFPDYISEIFPTFIKYYLTVDNPKAPNIAFIYISMIAALGVLMMISGVALERLKLAFASLALSFLCALLFWVQMKGIYYQLLPALGFGFIALGLFIRQFIARYAPNFKFSSPLALYAVLGIALLYSHGTQTMLNHTGYSQTPLYEVIQKCAPDCSFFLSGENMDITHQIALYSGAKHASRFPSLWFLPEIVKTGDSAEKQKFMGMMIDDLNRYKPEYFIVSNNLELSGIQNFNLIDYLSTEADFKDVIAQYKKTDILHDNRNNYRSIKMPENDFKISYDIYKKIR